MSPRVRQNAGWLVLAALGAAVCAWLGLKGFEWSDYESEARPAFEALVHGHPLAFLRLAPSYGGSLVLRAPLALLPSLWGGGALAVYRAVSLPGVLALAMLGCWLALRMRARGQSRLAAAVALALCVLNPAAVYALEYGHPEDLICAAFVVAAVICACQERPLLAGALAGLAFATKAWGLIALAPALAALPRQRPRALAAAIVCATLVLSPLMLARSSEPLASSGAGAAQSGGLFQPWQAWWWFGSKASFEHTPAAHLHPGYRAAPAWVSRIAHPLIVLLPIPLSVLWLLRRRRRRWDALALLALALLARCALDPWDNLYYALPFLLALCAWETIARERPPALALLATLLVPVSFVWAPSYLSPDGQSLLFAAWTLPLAAMLAFSLYAPQTLVDRLQMLWQPREPLAAVLADHHEILDPHSQLAG
ncbi:MAG TPA: glycosyltransferase 87 family protein [Solirubrobacteraceae bacterium]|nr:glycosyltransferase 87 family protein [Solirubrobacteraceae bacterium]